MTDELELSPIYETYIAGKPKVVFAWSLSIVDCYAISSAFLSLVPGNSVVDLVRSTDAGHWSERVGLRDAYGIHAIDTEVPAGNLVLVHEPSGAACFWDADERFVAVVGEEAFLRLVRPYPDEIERDYYVQMMSTVGVNEVSELGRFFDRIKAS